MKPNRKKWIESKRRERIIPSGQKFTIGEPINIHIDLNSDNGLRRTHILYNKIQSDILDRLNGSVN